MRVFNALWRHPEAALQFVLAGPDFAALNPVYACYFTPRLWTELIEALRQATG